MTDKGRSGLTQPGLTATVSSALIAIAAICYPDDVSSGVRQAVAALIAVVSPFIVVALMRWYHKLDMDPDLLKTVNYYEKDLKFQRRQLKEKNLPDEVRKKIEGHMQSTLEKLATVHQDYASGNLKVKKSR
ncbi:hypothetical protein [Pseudomonas aeruginosa]|uniref:hypothetical protein n=1 Tax=Pseudomonas aeruginosa TaxID=287 RepID=UPI0013CDEB29|nr:hypothetical protein [Pseudomonas aeruginosa]